MVMVSKKVLSMSHWCLGVACHNGKACGASGERCWGAAWGRQQGLGVQQQLWMCTYRPNRHFLSIQGAESGLMWGVVRQSRYLWPVLVIWQTKCKTLMQNVHLTSQTELSGLHFWQASLPAIPDHIFNCQIDVCRFVFAQVMWSQFPKALELLSSTLCNPPLQAPC